MASFMLSSGVQVTEKDLTNIIPAVATARGAFAGAFQWGPVMDPTTISSENILVQRFGKPASANAMSWFTAANYLSYSSDLTIVRADVEAARNAVATKSGTVTTIAITNGGSGYVAPVITIGGPNIEGGVQATASATVEGGVITLITVTEPGTGYTGVPSVDITDSAGISAVATASVATGGIKINNQSDYETNYINGAGMVGEFAAKYPGAGGNSIKVSMCDSADYETWTYKSEFQSAPGTSAFVANTGGSQDEMHIIVIDVNGAWTGTAGAILEKYSYVSKASDARKTDGASNYYKNVINANSKYLWWMDHPADVDTGAAWGTAASNTAYALLTAAYTTTLSGGVTALTATDGNLMSAYALFANDAELDISLVMAGHASTTVANYIISNIAEVRRDCVAFVSPNDTGEVIQGNDAEAIEAIIAYRNALPSTSYAVMDSGYKYQYDRYNDAYRWVPLNGDVAGLCARTDFTNDPWWSPAGLNRGQIKNVIKLSTNPNKTDRDALYQSGINPVVSFPGQGVVLYGDKTMLSKPSAFDRINVRRLFIVLEKAIATASKYMLFEFNDPFTRALFRSMVEPFLRDVQGNRGITDFKVVADETNNTGEVIDGNEFVADIYIKPNRSINFITLNFISARSGISFEEIGA